MSGQLSFSTLQIFNWLLIAIIASVFVFFTFIQAGIVIAGESLKGDEKRKTFALFAGKWHFTLLLFTLMALYFFYAFPFFFKVSFVGVPIVWFMSPFLFLVQGIVLLFGRSTNSSFVNKILIISGNMGVFFAGLSIGSFFSGSGFMITTVLDSGKEIIETDFNNPLLGIEALLDLTNLFAALMLLFLSRIIASVYINSKAEGYNFIMGRNLLWNTLFFTVFMLAFFIDIFLKKGCAFMPDTGLIFFEKYKYFSNMVNSPLIGTTALTGIILIYYSVYYTLKNKNKTLAGSAGMILLYFSFFMNLGFNYTAFYPSTYDFQSAITIWNGSAEYATLYKVSYGSIIITIAAVYIYFVWRKS